MDAKAFASWLANLLAGASPTGDKGIRIVITDGKGEAAEVTFDGEWVWETIGSSFVWKETP